MAPGDIASVLRQYVTSADRLIATDVDSGERGDAQLLELFGRHEKAGHALEQRWAKLDSQARFAGSLDVVIAWLRAYNDLQLVPWMLAHLDTLRAKTEVALQERAPIYDRRAAVTVIKTFSRGSLILLDSVPVVATFLMTHGSIAQQKKAQELADRIFDPTFITAAAAAVSALRAFATYTSSPANLATLSPPCGVHGSGPDGADPPACPCLRHAGAAAASMAALTGAKYLRFVAQHLTSCTTQLHKEGHAPFQAALLGAVCSSRLLPAVAEAILDAPEVEDPGVRGHAAFDLHHAAKDAAQALSYLQRTRVALLMLAEGGRSGGGGAGGGGGGGAGRGGAAAAVAAAAAAGEVVAAERGAQARALEEVLADPAVRRLQVAMLERLIVHGGGGGGGSSGGGGIGGSSSSSSSWWLARMEARSGMVALIDPQVVPLDETGSQDAPWLEDEHCNVIYSTLLLWGSMTAAQRKPPPEQVAALAARAAEAVYRLCCGQGLGGRGYTPEPQWQLAKTQSLVGAFNFAPLAGELPPRQARQCLPSFLEATAWALAIQSEALLAEARGEGGTTAAERGGPPRSILEMLAQPGHLGWGVQHLIQGMLSTACGIDGLGPDTRAEVTKRMWRAGVAATFDRTLRLALAAEARAAEAAAAGGAAGGATSSFAVVMAAMPMMQAGVLPLLAPPPAKTPSPAATTSQAATGHGSGGGASGGGGCGGGGGGTRLGLLVTGAKYAAALSRQLDAEGLHGQPRDPKTAYKSGNVLLMLGSGLSSFQADVQEQLRAVGVEAAVRARAHDPAAMAAAGAAATSKLVSADGLEAAALALRSACGLAAATAAACVTSGSALGALPGRKDYFEAVGSCLSEWSRHGLYPLLVPGPQLLACQPHRLLAAACELLRATGATMAGSPGRKVLAAALVDALAAAATHEDLSRHAHEWLAPAAAAVGGSGGGDGPLRGCLAARVRSVLPELLRLAPPHGGVALVLLKLAAAEPPPPPLPLRLPSSADDISDFRLAANAMGAHLLGASGPDQAVSVMRVRLPPDGFCVADYVAAHRAEAVAAQAAAAAALPGRVALDPAEVAWRHLLVCGNPACGVFDEGAEAEMRLRKCGGCQVVRYCGAVCQRAHWQGGHKAECPRLSASSKAGK